MGSLAARPGLIRDMWLLNDRWPDTRTFTSMAHGIFKFFGAQTEEQKAVAVYDWVCLSMRRANAVYEGPPGAMGYNLEPGRMFHGHGHHYCDGLGRLMAAIWSATGRPARKTVIKGLGHTVAELWYADADGVARWHVFDPQKGFYVYDRSATHIASFAEIAADHSLMTDPSRTSDPYFYHARERAGEQANLDYFTHGWIASINPECDYAPHLDLQPGQQWEIFFGPEGPGFPACGGGVAENAWDARSNFNDQDGTVINRKVWPWRGQYLTKVTDDRSVLAGRQAMPHGTARLTWDVPLEPTALAACGAQIVGQVACDGQAGVLTPGLSRELAQVVIPIQLPYQVTRLRLEADILRTGDNLNHVILFGSLDNENWQQLTPGYWGNVGTLADKNAGQIDIGPETYGKTGWSPIGSYDLFLRIDLCSIENIDAVGVKGLKLVFDTETNLFAHCHLQPGENHLGLAGIGQQGSASVDVTLHWAEAGRAKSAVKQGVHAGDNWLIEANVDDPSQIRMQKIVYRHSGGKGATLASEATADGAAHAGK